ncbi:MAG TPA: tyrosine-protein phosphatase [Bacteriovoracaceae bacterium]|nr:tyrosine-protein phosphatase [Bacteriovoracaceae bacterium]
MKTTLFFTLLVLSFNSFAVDGLTIPNSHQVDKEGNIFRGREPKKLVDELAHIGITDVILFKNEVKTEVQEEKANLARLGIRAHHLPFRWKEYPSMEEACVQTVDALNILHQVKRINGKVFFHCTAGEDRTGMLSGLYRMLTERLSREAVFAGEMCGRGYSDGNPHKPYMVTAAIQKELTPLFMALSAKVMSGEWQLGRISRNSCKNLSVVPTNLRCRN